MPPKPDRKGRVSAQRRDQDRERPGLGRFAALDFGRSHRRLLAGVLGAIAFLLYANTLDHRYTFDDDSLIEENVLTRKGVAGIPEILQSTYRQGSLYRDLNLYRPLSRVVYAVQWQLSPGNPALGHWTNVLLYSLTAVLLFYVIDLYTPGNVLRSVLVSALFVTHPLHTEVVASVKSLDEILAFLLCLATMLFARRHVDLGERKWLFFSAASFFLALLSKESALTFLAVTPLALWFFTEARGSWIGRIVFALGTSAALYLSIRLALFGIPKVAQIQILDNVLSEQDGVRRFATAVTLMGRYLWLLVVPHPLVSDYSFAELPVVGPGDGRFLAAFAVLAALALFALGTARRKSCAAFGILYFFLTVSLVSNVFFVIGTAFAERLMYAPSLGACIVAGTAFSALLGGRAGPAASGGPSWRRTATAAAIAVVLAVYSGATISRNTAWFDNLSLFTTDVKRSPNSARLHYLLGLHVSSDGFVADLPKGEVGRWLELGTRELTRAIEIFPGFADAHNALGRILLKRGDVKGAEADFTKAIALNERNPLYRNNYASVLVRTGRLKEAEAQLSEAVRWHPCYADAYHNLGAVHGMQAELLSRQQNETQARRSFEQAIDYFRKAIDCNPQLAEAYEALGMTLRVIGEEREAQRILGKAKELGRRER